MKTVSFVCGVPLASSFPLLHRLEIAQHAPMRFGRRLVFLAMLAVTLGGCGYTYHFRDDGMGRGEEHHEWASFFLFGIVGHYELDVRDICPGGTYEVTTGNNFLTWLVSGLTIGIYTPRKVNVWCGTSKGAATAAYEVDFGSDGLPVHLVKRVAGRAFGGEVKPTADGRFGVMLREGVVR